MGPIACPIPAQPRMSPPARPAFSFGSAANVMPRIAGNISAAPMPMAPRAAMSQYSFWAAPPSTDMSMKIVVPTKKIRFRPNRSASLPPVTISIPKTSAYALITHCTVETSLSKAFSIEGSATLSAVKSWARMRMLSPIATSASTVLRFIAAAPPRGLPSLGRLIGSAACRQPRRRPPTLR